MITQTGIKNFGDFVEQTMIDRGMTQDGLAEFLKERTGVTVSRGIIQRIVHGYWSGSVKLEVLIALQATSFLTFPDGRSMTFDDIVAILQEKIDPLADRSSSKAEVCLR